MADVLWPIALFGQPIPERAAVWVWDETLTIEHAVETLA